MSAFTVYGRRPLGGYRCQILCLTSVKTILPLAALTCGLHVLAQADAPPAPAVDYLNFAGGSLEASVGNHQQYVGISPYVGRFLSPNLALVGGLGYRLSHSKTDGRNALEQSGQNIRASAGLRTYVGKEAPLRFFVSASVFYGFYTASSTNVVAGLPKEKSSGTASLGALVSPNVSYTIGRVNLLANFGGLAYSFIPETKNDDGFVVSPSSSRLDLSLSTGLSLGAEFRF